MNETIYNKNGYQFLYVDNWFNKNEEKLIWKELDFFTQKNIETSDSLIDKDERGVPKGQSFRIYPYKIYSPYGLKYSNLVNLTSKQKTDDFKKLLKKTFGNYYRSWSSTNSDTFFVSYYEKGDYYNAHIDVAAFSVLLWFYKKPKKFTGGDLILNDTKEKIECKHNRLIIFPSWYYHSVTPIHFKNKPKELGWGRYTLTSFYQHAPQNDD